GAGGDDVLVIYDQAFDGFTRNTLTASTFQSFHHGGLVSYSGMSTVILHVSNHNSQSNANDNITFVDSTAAGTTVSVICGRGRDQVLVSNSDQNLENLAGDLEVVGGGGNAQLVVNDQAFDGFTTYTLNFGEFHALAHGNFIRTLGLSSLTL